MFGPGDVIVGITSEMIHNWEWFLAFGVILMLLGIAAVVRSITTTVVSIAFFGWLLVLASIADLIPAFMVGKWAGFFLHLLAAILFGITGILMITKPTISAEAWTFVMSVFFLVAGLYLFIGSLWIHLPGWGWQALNGIIAAVMGGLLLAQWPVTGFWVIGLFVGIELMIYGWAWIALALDLHKM
jgi:uncharacterized membrane protein HdeD (DUF308 family)